PPWMNDALAYFALIDGGDEWKQLVKEWVGFERALGFPHGQEAQNRLPTELRPAEVRIWMKNHRSYEKIAPIRSAQFAVEWKDWWRHLQPSLRLPQEGMWPLPRVTPVDPDEWDALCRGGNNGFFLIVLTLAWWISACHVEEQPLDDVLQAVEDVLWVCLTLRAGRTAHNGKRRANDVGKSEKPPSKRVRV
ncbi:hypothetical protein C8Q73DRAFT_645790, partial [Cubamyces lactineus]